MSGISSPASSSSVSNISGQRQRYKQRDPSGLITKKETRYLIEGPNDSLFFKVVRSTGVRDNSTGGLLWDAPGRPTLISRAYHVEAYDKRNHVPKGSDDVAESPQVPKRNLNGLKRDLMVPSRQLQALIGQIISNVDHNEECPLPSLDKVDEEGPFPSLDQQEEEALIPSLKSQDPAAKTVLEDAAQREMLPKPKKVKPKELSQEGISPSLSPVQQRQVLGLVRIR